MVPVPGVGPAVGKATTVGAGLLAEPVYCIPAGTVSVMVTPVAVLGFTLIPIV